MSQPIPGPVPGDRPPPLGYPAAPGFPPGGPVGPSTAIRPGAAVLAIVMTSVVAFLCLVDAVIQFVIELPYEVTTWHKVIFALLSLSVSVAGFLAAGLLAAGAGFGRTLAGAVLGAMLLMSGESWSTVLVSLLDGFLDVWVAADWWYRMPSLVGGFISVVGLIALGSRRIGEWEAARLEARRGRPAGTVPTPPGPPGFS